MKKEKQVLLPGFCLNLHDRDSNPQFESHDPSMMYDPVSGYCYSYSTDSAITSEYRQGIPVRKTKDLVHFEFVGYALSEAAIAEGRDNGTFEPTRGFWAPYAEYVKGEYRLYYSATKAFGSSESRIWLAVSSHPEGPFENRGIVMDTWGTDDTFPNAIDPHIVWDKDNCYLVYGSFFGGIYLKELNPENGMPADKNVHSLGVRIAHRPENSHVDGPEGAAVMYHPEEKYFYLFLSYGWLGDTYDIRVGRSTCVTGPYLDREGRSMDGESLGQKLAGSYRFWSEKPFASETGKDWSFGGFRGPGHGVPFYHEKIKRYFFVHHIRDGAEQYCYRAQMPGEKTSYRMHYLMVRAMYFAAGWPLLSPEPFTGEPEMQLLPVIHPDNQSTRQDVEWIVLENNNNELAVSQTLVTAKGCMGFHGVGFDFENSRICGMITLIDSENRILWGKYAYKD